MSSALLIDIGSTYTKVSFFNLREAALLTRAQASTTVSSDVNVGLEKALEQIPNWQDAEYLLACSSAAGGLKIAAIGLVPDLTAEAARRAALGAGSRVVKTYSYELTDGDVEELQEINADIILLAGGTDGGNKEIIIGNARKLAESELDQPILVAGNRSAVSQVEKILQQGQKNYYITENVMPKLEELNIEPARQKIREIFLEKIVAARGLDKVKKVIDGVIMPTPAAVLNSAELLAEGTASISGWGELLVVDIGGATTDIHSAAKGEPRQAGVSQRGLEEPFMKRTVEGDLGMRYCARELFEVINISRWQKTYQKLYQEELNIDKLKDYIGRITTATEYLPENSEEMKLENLLGREAVRLATARHAGSIKTIYTPQGASFIQRGKDLTGIKNVIGTGGIIVHNECPEVILQGVLQENQAKEESLTPTAPNFFLDDNYIMAAMGLLAEVEREAALRILQKYIKQLSRGKE